MYDFENSAVNKMLVAAVSFIGFIIFTLILPGVVSTIMTVTLFWSLCGLICWSLGRISGTVEDETDVPFYKETKFYEYIARGPISFIKYFE